MSDILGIIGIGISILAIAFSITQDTLPVINYINNTEIINTGNVTYYINTTNNVTYYTINNITYYLNITNNITHHEYTTIDYDDTEIRQSIINNMTYISDNYYNISEINEMLSNMSLGARYSYCDYYYNWDNEYIETYSVQLEREYIDDYDCIGEINIQGDEEV